MSKVDLLAIVEVPHEKRVVCQAQGCGHSVYRRIHVVRTEGKLVVLGSECYSNLFGGSSRTPSYSSSAGRPLTDDEREMLVANTTEFIARLEQEHRAGEATRQQTRLMPTAPPQVDSLPPEAPVYQGRRPMSARLAAVTPTTEEMSLYEAQAKRDVAEKFRVNPDLPGWRGLVIQRVLEIARPKRTPPQ